MSTSDLRPANKKCHVLSRSATTFVAVVDLEQRYGSVKGVDESVFELSSAAMRVYEVLKRGYNVCVPGVRCAFPGAAGGSEAVSWGCIKSCGAQPSV